MTPKTPPKKRSNIARFLDEYHEFEQAVSTHGGVFGTTLDRLFLAYQARRLAQAVEDLWEHKPR